MQQLLRRWRDWGNGPQTEKTIWGHPVWYWRRIGKSIQLLSAFTFLVDIAGPQRLSRFAASIQPPQISYEAVAILFFISALLFAAWFHQRGHPHHMSALLSIPLAVMVLVVISVLIAPAAQGLAWLLGHPNLAKIVKVAGVTVYIVGFHFDFLGS